MESTKLVRGEGRKAHPLPPFASKVRYSADFLPDFLAGFNVPFHSVGSVDSRGCSPKTNSLPSNPSWSAHELPPARRTPNPEARSRSATWCSSGQAPTPTGRQACSWSARCATTAACLASCSGHIGAVTARLGTRTASPRSRASEELHSGLRTRQSVTPATSRNALDVSEGDKCVVEYEYYVNLSALVTPNSRHNIRYRGLGRAPPFCFCPSLRTFRQEQNAAASR